jgi:hypothetical protein
MKEHRVVLDLTTDTLMFYLGFCDHLRPPQLLQAILATEQVVEKPSEPPRPATIGPTKEEETGPIAL